MGYLLPLVGNYYKNSLHVADVGRPIAGYHRAVARPPPLAIRIVSLTDQMRGMRSPHAGARWRQRMHSTRPDFRFAQRAVPLARDRPDV